MSIIKNYWQWILFILIIGGVAFWNSNINPFQTPSEKGEILTTEQIDKMLKDSNNNGKRVALIGRPRISNFDMVIHLGKPTSIRFEGKDGNHVGSFGLYHGEGKNEFSLPKEFKPEDLKIYDQEGNPHSYDEYLQISFTLEKVEGADPEIDKDGYYVWNFTDIRIDPAP